MARHLTQRVFISHLLKAQQFTRPVSPLRLEGCSSFFKVAWQTRSLHKDIEVSDHTCEVSNYDEYLTNHKPIILIMVQTLKEILGTTTRETNKIIMSNPQFKKRSRTNVLSNYYNLLEVGVQKNTIARNVWLLTHENNKLKNKLNCINILNMNNNELIPWIRLTQDELSNYISYVQNDAGLSTYNKIEYLAQRLECSVQELCELTIRCSFLLKIPITYIDKKLSILHEYDVSNKNILKDLWVFRYSENHIRHRCELYKDTENLEVKTWAIRCPLRIITKAIHKNRLERYLMQHHKNINEFLMSKLNVDEMALELATAKWPAILRVNIAKLNNVINILHENKITSDEILQHGRIFYFNIKTIEKRIESLKKQGIIPKITILIVSEESFERYMKKNQIERELLLSQQDAKGYLMHKLNVDEKTLKSATTRWPGILRVKIIKLAQLIDMLQQNGIESHEILKHGRVFQFKTTTLHERIETLKENGLEPKLTVITFSKKSFDQYIETHKLSH